MIIRNKDTYFIFFHVQPLIKNKSILSILQEYVRNLILFIFVLLALVTCHPNVEKPVDFQQLTLKTDASTVLYFKNVRSIFYRIEEDTITGFHIYSMKNFDPDCKLVINHNWRNDTAFPILQTQIQDSVYVVPLERNVALNSKDLSEQLALTALIYNNSVLGHTTQLISGDTLFVEKDQRESFRKSYFDFLKLTNQR